MNTLRSILWPTPCSTHWLTPCNTLCLAVILYSANTLSNPVFSNDLEIISRHEKPFVLSSDNGRSKIIVSAKHQGRVLTSTATGDKGISNGWLDYKGITTNTGSAGGEDRLWLAPIGSKHSLFYEKGTPIQSKYWRVPPALEEKQYAVVSKNTNSIVFQKKMTLHNYIGTEFFVEIKRKITLFTRDNIESYLNIKISKNLPVVGFSSQNTLINLGDDWKRERGLITLWSLGMFQGHDSTVSIFPVSQRDAFPTVHRYLEPLPKNRLKITKKAVFYRTDGRYRSKIGLPKSSAKNIMAAYTPSLQRLTLVKFLFRHAEEYPAALETDSLSTIPGDVTNAYNNGANTSNGENLASFYELESAAELKALKRGEHLRHEHATFHFYGDKAQLNTITTQLLNHTVDEITGAFGQNSSKKISKSRSITNP